ncbi:Glutathione transport system permease protein GsiD [Corynebacterium ciconiae DSM 44920]|uniref:ABC transporter permease n=1 Tax=Corynebacterium ciconiae TaxID=227319 RepID=UPI00037272FE|nr:ABC transporter permease [Corynebacterium ciconiae]WKD60646.1 Glutathione transport system permease protein GsiD [Corynebacterium ciconiae DSM 44920]
MPRSSRGPRGARRRLPTSLIIGGTLVALVVLTALVALVWTPFDPLHAMPQHRLAGPSAEHWLGTDRYGRDVASQLMAGAHITLGVGMVAVSIGMLCGVPLGMTAAMRGGMVDALVMRGADLLLAFPALLLAIVLGAVLGTSTWSAMVAIGIAAIPGFARVARAATLSVLSQDFIAAARMSQASGPAIALRHVLPNILSLVIVQASVAFALAILAEAGLSFLGLGTPPPEPSWGRMLQSAQASLYTAPQLALWPGLTIAATVLGFNLLGDGLRDLLDPRLHSTRKASQ